jgi:arabinofuranosyltransferase
MGVALLIGSKAFIDYSTSGLENPLTHLLLVLFLWVYLSRPLTRHTLGWLALIAGLATLNRMDALLLLLPALAWAAWKMRRQHPLLPVLAGFSPFVLWEVFSILYYGFPFPNTAYAKLGTGISAHELMVQGGHYLLNSLRLDPLTLTATLAVFVWVLLARKGSGLPLVLGAALYLLYTVRIGGDFMSGRFLAAPLLIAVVLLVWGYPLAPRFFWPVALALVLGLSLSAPHPPLLSGLDYGQGRQDITDTHGIADERAAYYPFTGLLRAVTAPADTAFPIHGWADWGRRLRASADQGQYAVVAWPYVGFLGYYAGPYCHLIDVFGLGDPLLARLPARRDEPWRIGHFNRVLPEGYLETYLYGPSLIAQADLASFYDKLKLVVSGPLFAQERWREIWKMNTGHYAALLDRPEYRHPSSEDIGRATALTLQRPITFKPDAFANYRALGDLYYARGQFALALAVYVRAAGIDPAQVERHHPDDYQRQRRDLHLRLAQVCRLAGDFSPGIDALEAFLSLAPEDAELHYELGRLHFAAGRFDSSAAAFGRAARLAPENPKVHFNLGTALQRLGHVSQAVHSYKRALGLRPQDPLFHHNLGAAFLEQGDLARAEASLLRSIQFGSEDVQTYLALGWIYGRSGRQEDQVEVYRRLLEKDLPHVSADTYAQLGRELGALGRMADAEAAFRKAREAAPAANPP